MNTINKRNNTRFNNYKSGFTLIELMVSLVISLIVVAAASYVYLYSRQSNRSTDAATQLNEQGRQALELVLREVEMAWASPTVKSISTVQNDASTWPYVFNNSSTLSQDLRGDRMHGLYGCSASLPSITFDGTAPPVRVPSCSNAGRYTFPGPGGATIVPDSVMVSHFTFDYTRTSNGQGADCLGQALVPASAGVGDQFNFSRSAAVSPLPVQAINSFAIRPTVISQEGVNVTIGSLACVGNGNPGVWQPIFLGVDDMVISYGVGNNVAGDVDTSPATAGVRYYTATEVNSLPGVTEKPVGAAFNVVYSPWRSVTSVRVCLMVRTQVNTAGANQTLAGTTRDCRGNLVEGFADGWVRRAFTGTVSLRNRNQSIVGAPS
jgi:type IV pilus assembly protein PilW